jgi:hypothetical protein
VFGVGEAVCSQQLSGGEVSARVRHEARALTCILTVRGSSMWYVAL